MKNTKELKSNIIQAFRISILFGAAASVGLFAIMRETNIMFFENDKGTVALSIMAFCILAASVVITGASILQGVGYIFQPVTYLIISFLIKIALNFFLIPAYGIEGAAIATFISIFVLATLIFGKLTSLYGLNIFRRREWVKLLTLLFTLYIGVVLCRKTISYCLGAPVEGRIGAAVVVMISVLFGASIFLTLILKLRLLSWNEIEQLPGGQKLAVIFNRSNVR